MQVTLDVATLLGEHKVDAIVCVAGGWAGGNCGSKGQRSLIVTPDRICRLSFCNFKFIFIIFK